MKNTKLFLLTIALLATNVNLFSQTADEWKKLGNAELDSSNYDKAIEYYQKAIEADSNYFDAYYNLGLTFTIQEKWDEAIAYYNKALTKDDSSTDSYYMLGSVYANKKEWNKSIESCNKAIALNDTLADNYFLLGSVYAELKDYDKAIEMYKTGIRLHPDSPEEHYTLGLYYQEKGNYLYATLYIKKAAQLGLELAQQQFTRNGNSWEDNHIKPDYDEIKRNIENQQSTLYYPKVWNKYQQGDSTMSVEEKQHLYYGYVFNKNYSPYAPTLHAKEINTILAKEKPSKKEWKKLVALINASLQVEPFNCRYLYYQHLAYNALNKTAEADKNRRKIDCIADALASTGDGLSKETAIHVIAVPSEYDYLFLNNLSMHMQALVDGCYDVFSLNPNNYGLEEMWFDVTQSFLYLNRSLNK